MAGIDISEEWEKHKAEGKNKQSPPATCQGELGVDYSKLDERLIEILELRPVERTLKIKNAAEEFGCDETQIKEELKLIQQKQKELQKAEREKEKLEEQKRKEELKLRKEKEKQETKAEEEAEREKEALKKRLEEEDVKKKIEQKMQSDFSFKIINLIASNQEDEATELIAKRIEGLHHFYSTKSDIKSEMWIYKNGIYEPNGKSHIEFMCREWMGKAYNKQRANNVISKINADTQIEEDYFFNKQSENISEIPVKNGILNIFTRELSPFTHKKIFFNKLPLTYTPEAKCPAVEQFFRDVLRNEEDALVMYELIGFTLLKEYRYEKAFMLVGDGRNGKGKTINLIKRFLGAQNYSSVPMDQFNTSSSGIHELFGKLINLAGDIANTSLKDTGLLKQLCGRDNINAKRKYLRDLSFENYAKLIFAANELPRVYDFSYGFWSRWVLLEFPYTFLPHREFEKTEDKRFCKLQDENIINKISTEEELNGLLNLALDGLDRLRKNGNFSYTKGTSEVKNMWIRKADSFMAFCMDLLEEQSSSHIEKKNLRKVFHTYCKKHKLKGTSDKNIKAVLESMFGVTEIRLSGGDWNDMAWDGIKFVEEKI